MYNREEAHGDGPHQYHKEEHYGKYDKKTLCLQEIRRTISQDGVVGETSGVFKSEFRCCEKEDDPEFCLDPDYYEHSDEYKGGKQQHSFLDDLVNPAIVATCLWQTIYTPCPDDPARCNPAVLNCTISQSAERCGWPKMQFGTNAFYFGYDDASSCLSYYDPLIRGDEGKRKLQASVAGADYVVLEPEHNTTVFSGFGTILKADVAVVSDYDGYKQVKGKLEFGTFFFTEERKIPVEFEKMLAAQKKKPAAPKQPSSPQKKPQGPQMKHKAPAKKHEVDAETSSINYGRGDADPARTVPFINGGQLLLTLYEPAHY